MRSPIDPRLARWATIVVGSLLVPLALGGCVAPLAMQAQPAVSMAAATPAQPPATNDAKTTTDPNANPVAEMPMRILNSVLASFVHMPSHP